MKSRFLTILAWPFLVVPQALTYLGALLNQIAVNANQGMMPAYYSGCTLGKEGEVINGLTVLDPMHQCLTSASHFKILCDWINLHASVLSPGDILLALGDLTVGPFFWFWIAYVVYRCFRDEISLF